MTNGIDPLKAASIASKRTNGPVAPAHANANTVEAAGKGDKAKAPAAGQRANEQHSVKGVSQTRSENRVVTKGENDFSVAVDQNTGVMVVRITDHKTGEVVKQIPAQEFIEADLSMEQIVGLIIDDQA